MIIKNSNKIHQTHDYKIKRTSPGFDEFTLKNSTAVHSRSENGFKKIMCVDCGMTKYTGIDIPVYPDYISGAL